MVFCCCLRHVGPRGHSFVVLGGSSRVSCLLDSTYVDFVSTGELVGVESLVLNTQYGGTRGVCTGVCLVAVAAFVFLFLLEKLPIFLCI